MQRRRAACVSRSALPRQLPVSRMPVTLRLCAADDVPEGGALKVEAGGLVLAVFNVGGRIHVTDDQCTHGPGSLSEGWVEGDEIECDFHNGRFHIPSGAVTGPPCMVPLRTYEAQVVDGAVMIDPAPRPLAHEPPAGWQPITLT
jgi:biphenyl 2,3-dioxygenase ferredoxin subunit